jgi:hypothetical protein
LRKDKDIPLAIRIAGLFGVGKQLIAYLNVLL